MPDFFNQIYPNIDGNTRLRTPQVEGFEHIRDHFQTPDADREVSVVLPVGCGKSGLIAITPFATEANRVLVVAPYVKIADQLLQNFDPTTLDRCFYNKCSVLEQPPFPEPCEIRGTTTNQADLEAADVVITNIDQLQGAENRWLTSLPDDFFDLILFDEGHHAVAQSWATLRRAFPNARIVNFSATPRRADGQLMPGRVIYSFSVRDAISQGYVKRLRGLVLNPASLRYVRHEDGQEVEVTLEEVRRLGEEDAQFRRSIVSSEETLSTIVDASIRELERIRQETGDQRHKIIASALNFQHCHQIVEAYQGRGRRAAFVHSRQDSAANDRILNQLENHELDVIVQVRKLGEGFDHPYLSVAAVCSIFAELSPFVQFVGRIMRVIDHNDTESPNNQGTVIFHAGSNVANRWDDFRDFSEADQEFFDQLLPVEALDFTNSEEIEIQPRVARPAFQVQAQTDVVVQEIPLLHDEAAADALLLLQSRGYSAEQITEAYQHLPVPTTRVRERQAGRQRLHDDVQNLTGSILRDQNINAEGHELDRQYLGKTNYQVIVSRINVLISERVADKPRHDYSQNELDAAQAELPSIRQFIIEEFFNA